MSNNKLKFNTMIQIPLWIGGYVCVWADVRDGLAIHKDLDEWDLYTVTHVNTGGKCHRPTTLKKAAAVRDKLASVSVGSVSLGQLPACETVALFPLLAEKVVRSIYGRSPDQELVKERQEEWDRFLHCHNEEAQNA